MKNDEKTEKDNLPDMPDCWVRACKYNKGGKCQDPERPMSIGCALTWFFTGNAKK